VGLGGEEGAGLGARGAGRKEGEMKSGKRETGKFNRKERKERRERGFLTTKYAKYANFFLTRLSGTANFSRRGAEGAERGWSRPKKGLKPQMHAMDADGKSGCGFGEGADGGSHCFAPAGVLSCPFVC